MPLNFHIFDQMLIYLGLRGFYNSLYYCVPRVCFSRKLGCADNISNVAICLCLIQNHFLKFFCILEVAIINLTTYERDHDDTTRHWLKKFFLTLHKNSRISTQQRLNFEGWKVVEINMHWIFQLVFTIFWLRITTSLMLQLIVTI